MLYHFSGPLPEFLAQMDNIEGMDLDTLCTNIFHHRDNSLEVYDGTTLVSSGQKHRNAPWATGIEYHFIRELQGSVSSSVNEYITRYDIAFMQNQIIELGERINALANAGIVAHSTQSKTCEHHMQEFLLGDIERFTVKYREETLPLPQSPSS